MARIEDIQQRWREHEAASFPKGLRGRSVGGVDLTLLESNIARFIMSAIELKGPLPNRSRTMLEDQRKILEGVLPKLEGDSRSYFERLRGLANDVLVL